MRQIKASEVKPGMKVQFDLEGWDVKGTVGTVTVRPHAVWIYTDKWREMPLNPDAPVTVLTEPQPEEPTEFGARVRTPKWRYVRGYTDGFAPWSREDSRVLSKWEDICAEGPVQVIPDQGWTVPDNSPEVPERIEEWPEDDTALRAYQWRDCYKNVLDWNKTQWRKTTPAGYSFPADGMFDGPWDRVTDA